LSSIELVFTKIFYLADRTQFACTASSHACKPLAAILSTFVMKTSFFLVALILIFQISIGQNSKIDRLNSKSEIESLIHSFDKKYEKFTLKPIAEFKDDYGNTPFCKRIADSLKITQSFYKADFDKNGFTDLLAIGDYYDFTIFIVMNYKNDSITINRLTRRSFQECAFPKITNDTIIKYYQMSRQNWPQPKSSKTLQSIELIYKYGDFIDFNPKPKIYSIEKIEYQTTMCFGSCPKFYLSIDKNKRATYKAEAYNRATRNSQDINGVFNTDLNETDYEEIVGLLNYIDFPNLNDNYSVSWTDDQTSTLTITYDNGQVKQIRDYGLIGTYGLDRLYQLLFELRFNQDWK
jgi:hypothetical protein